MKKKIVEKKWTQEDLCTHIKANIEDYGAAVVVAMLYRKLYGEYPKIGLSGCQVEFAESVKDKLPEPNPNAKHM